MSTKIQILKSGNFNSRVLHIEITNKKLVTPTYFPSISSAATRIQLGPLIRACISSGYPRLLISAYDLYHLSTNSYDSISTLLSEFYKKDNFLFIDSGTFESYWLNDSTWDFTKYEEIIKQNKCEFYTSFDTIPNPDDDYKDIVNNTIDNGQRSTDLVNNNTCMTICHGQSPQQLCQVIDAIFKSSDKPNQVIAVPERDCGKTIQERTDTIRKIRDILNKYDQTNLLHILGCGHPVSMAIFAYAGADSFDSVDWSRSIIDPQSLKFVDTSHLSIINCSCRVCTIQKIDPTLQVLLHNLLFYQTYMIELQDNIIKNNDLQFLDAYLDQKTLSKIVNFF